MHDKPARLFVFRPTIGFLDIFSAYLSQFLVCKLKYEHDKLAKYIRWLTLHDV